MPPHVQIRAFTEADWPEVLAIVREVVGAGETYCADPEMSEQETRDFWLADECTLVAEVEGRLVGTAHCGPNRPAQGSHLGTASFMVSSSARGHGVGRALGEAVVARLVAQGFRGIQFNAVVETNVAAVRLWQDLGFVIVGTVPGAFRRPSGDFVGLHVMHKELA